MSKYVPDISSRRWVIISSNRQKRPIGYGDKDSINSKVCPFCPGNEEQTANEMFRIGKGEAGKPGWEVRVVSNKYPITDLHEIIIHSPHKSNDIVEFSHEQTEKLFKTYRQRYNFHKKDGQVLIFCNHGEAAGASIEHPHSQLVVIPFQINLDALSREPINNMVDEGDTFHVFCPDFSQWPYEVWITPKIAGSVFGDITDPEIVELSDVMQRILKRLQEIHKTEELSRHPFAYNYYIHPRESWYIRLIPRFVYRAGFELGTGLNVNVVDPEMAAMQLGECFADLKRVKKPAKPEEKVQTKATKEENKKAEAKISPAKPADPVSNVLDKLKSKF